MSLPEYPAGPHGMEGVCLAPSAQQPLLNHNPPPLSVCPEADLTPLAFGKAAISPRAPQQDRQGLHLRGYVQYCPQGQHGHRLEDLHPQVRDSSMTRAVTFDEEDNHRISRAPQSTSSGGIPDQLAAAKPLAWRGGSELPQLPWPCPCSGLVLVIDLWSGLGGLLVAVLSLGIRCIAVSAEKHFAFRIAKRKRFPNLVS